MSKIIKNITKWQIVFGLQLIATLALIIFVVKLGALPTLYLGIIVAVLAILCLLMFLFMKPSKKEGKGKIREAIGKIVSLLLSIVLIIGTLYIAQGDSTLSSITGANTQTTRFNVLVLNNSPYEKLSDIAGETVEVCDMYDNAVYFDEAVDALEKEESSLEISSIDDYLKLATDLYTEKVKAIFVNEAYNGVFEETYSTFSSDVRVIWSYDIEEKIEDISKDANVTKDVFTIYISGIDTTGKVSTVSRSDVNMLVTVNPKTKDILMTSIPRDYYVTLANKGKKDKLTHAGLGGVENSVKTIENFMDIDINYYARVNFTSLVKMVDALGGITVDSPYSFTSLHGKYDIVKGENYMDGEKALCFVRERYSLPNGDNDRVKNQQRVLTAMLKKAMSPTIITNYSSILKSIDGSFETNMSSSDITNLIQMQLSDMASWNIHQMSLTGTGKSMTGGAYMPNNKLYYMVPNQDSINKCSSMIKKMMNGEKIESVD